MSVDERADSVERRRSFRKLTNSAQRVMVILRIIRCSNQSLTRTFDEKLGVTTCSLNLGSFSMDSDSRSSPSSSNKQTIRSENHTSAVARAVD